MKLLSRLSGQTSGSTLSLDEDNIPNAKSFGGRFAGTTVNTQGRPKRAEWLTPGEDGTAEPTALAREGVAGGFWASLCHNDT